MVTKNLNPKTSKRQRRTGNLTQSLTVQIKQFLIHCYQRNLTQNTVDTYHRHLDKFEKHLFSVEHSILVSNIDKNCIEDYILFLKQVNKLNPNTINSVIRHLRAFFSYLVENSTIEINPLTKIKKLRIDEEPIKPFTERQVYLLLKQPDKSTYVGYRDFILERVLGSPS